jgi:hypothetical protein
MRRRRRTEDESDSLELLLDTITNVFGGIILMAILVVIQTQVTVGGLPDVGEDGRARILAEKELAFRADQLEEELLRLRSSMDSAESTFELTATPNAGRLDDRKAEFLAAIQAAQEGLKKRVKARREAQAQLERTEREAGRQEDELAQIETEEESLKRQLGVVASRNARRVRLPFQHSNSLRIQYSILVDGEKAYRLKLDCVATPFGRGTLHSPVSSAGYRVADPESQKVLLAAPLSSRSTFISFWVSRKNSSFATYQTLRKLFTEKGYEYSLYSYDSQTGLVLFSGNPDVE